MPEEYGQKHTFSSGIEVVILPFPSLRFEKFVKQSVKKFPLPKPPKKKIKVVDGTETVDDLTNEKYLDKKEIAEKKQSRWLSEKILTICLRDCIELDISQFEDIISVLEEDNEEEYPKNPLKRKVEFLSEYVIRSSVDFQNLTQIATNLMRIDDTEIAEQADSFPSDLAQPEDNGTEASGFDEIERVEVQSKS